jgi:nucleoside phosphorylase
VKKIILIEELIVLPTSLEQWQGPLMNGSASSPRAILSKGRNCGMTRPIPQVDVCIICALKEEADVVQQEVSKHCQTAFAIGTTDDDRFVYRYATITNNKLELLKLLLVCQTHPGPAFAARDVESLLDKFRPLFVGMSGICAGDKRHVRLGDLVVAEYAYHFEEGKVRLDQQGRMVHEPEGITYGPAEHILRYVHAFGAWETPVVALKKHVFNTDEPPRCVSALMASGMAVRSDDPFARWQQQCRKTWALDMEAASFYLALRNFPGIDGLVVKGVCDYADPSKDDVFHDFAARASALYLLTFIQEYVTIDTFRRERRGPFSVFTVPYQRNLFFTGRDELLTQIHTHFQTRQATTLALSGLSGIGKTQIAVEYAHRYQQEYQTVLWTDADTREALVSGYVTFADELKLQPQDKQDQTDVIKAVKAWLATQSKWLLILDHADDLSWIYEFLPARFDGHILLTTQAHATANLAHRIDVDPMPPDIGTLFLLRRALLTASDANLAEAAYADIAKARAICAELGGLPLALDQAGAYIDEMQCSLSDYLDCYRMHREDLLKRRGGLIADHPQSVATTFSSAFEQVQQKNAAALELLKFASYLGPDAIPLELITQRKVYLGALLEPVVADEFQLDRALERLQVYSLIQRDRKNRTLHIHRLVQAVLQESMNRDEGAKWKRRARNALSETLCDRCRKETGKHAEKQVNRYFDPIKGEEIVSRYTLPLFCNDCQEDLRVLVEDQTAFALVREQVCGSYTGLSALS